MSNIILKQSQIFTQSVLNSNDEEIGKITFKPSDASCLAGYSKLISLYVNTMEKTQAAGKADEAYEKSRSVEDTPENREKEQQSLDELIYSFSSVVKGFEEMQPVIDETFGTGAEKLLFNGGYDMPLMFALIEWASQYAGEEANKDWQDYKARAERMNAAKLNREQRRAKK